MRIPCDTIARLSNLLPGPDKGIFNSFRLDNGMIMVSDRMFMACEELDTKFEGVFHIAADEAMIEQCRIEAQWNSVIEFTAVPAIKYTTAITSMGFKIAENIGIWPDGPTDWDRWRDVILAPCSEPLAETKGPMVFSTDALSQLAQTSPSGVVALEQFINPAIRPVVVRDVDSPHWCGFFNARVSDGRQHVGATVPVWCK